MRKTSLFTLLLVALLTACSRQGDVFVADSVNELRAPTYPLVTIDPFTSAWSFTDKLNESPVRHWTGRAHPMVGALKVDGKVYRFMGVEDAPLDFIIPSALTQRWSARFTEEQPKGDWTACDYNDAAWKEGKAAFGTRDQSAISTVWTSEDIWVRREVELSADDLQKELGLEYSHDDVFELYINGKQIVSTGFVWRNNIRVPFTKEIKSLLKPGKNMIAAHCHNTYGGAYVDFGIYKKGEDVVFAEAAVQKSVNLQPTRTLYTFECGPVQLEVVFTSPLLMDDLDILSTPVNYVSYRVKPLDGKAHDVQIYMDATPEWAVNTPAQRVSCAVSREDVPMLYATAGTVEQAVLHRKGDDVRIDWGYFFLASPKKENVTIGSGAYTPMKKRFLAEGATGVAGAQLENVNQNGAVLAFSENLGTVTDEKSGYMMVAYDDLYSIRYFDENRMAYWKHNGRVTMLDALQKAAADYETVAARCREFDARMMADATKAGGKKYAELCALAYRQAIAAHKLITDKEGNLVFLSKENFSNGSIGTVDVTYPSAPLFLLYNPELAKGLLNHIFYYSESGRWTKPFAAHDIGTYPIGCGQTYGGDMPVEECGNMLILTAAIAVREGNAEYAKKHWETLSTWANYLLENGLDPENQLCTDDFAGHFAHNANLSIKAILGIAGYGKLAGMLGDAATEKKYIDAAKAMAAEWQKMAKDGDHYKLTFDKEGTWSQKYNLVWDRLLGLNIFDPSIATDEVAYYKTKQQPYGLPLDSRKTYTKSDWILWSACLTGNIDDFNALFEPVYKYANETESRMPISDWHETTSGNWVGFRARSVVGGYFIKMLESELMKK